MRFLSGAVLALLACLTVEAGVFAAPEREITIDQVEVTGVKVLAPEAVENSVEISTGEPLEQAKVVRTAQNLQAQYQRIGYEQVSIKTRLERRVGPGGKLQNILDISVVEGKPTRIANFQFMTDSDSVSYTEWKKIEKLLVARVKVKPGDVLGEETLSDVRRGVQEVLTSEEFIGSKMDDVRAIPTDPPKMIHPEDVDDTG